MAGDLMGLDAIATGEHNFRLMALCEIPFAAMVRTMSVEPAFQRQFLQIMSEALKNEYSHKIVMKIKDIG